MPFAPAFEDERAAPEPEPLESLPGHPRSTNVPPRPRRLARPRTTRLAARARTRPSCVPALHASLAPASRSSLTHAPGGLPDIPPRNRGVRPLRLVAKGRGEIRVSMVLSPDSIRLPRHAAPARSPSHDEYVQLRAASSGSSRARPPPLRTSILRDYCMSRDGVDAGTQSARRRFGGTTAARASSAIRSCPVRTSSAARRSSPPGSTPLSLRILPPTSTTHTHRRLTIRQHHLRLRPPTATSRAAPMSAPLSDASLSRVISGSIYLMRRARRRAGRARSVVRPQARPPARARRGRLPRGT
jgi:hypothetical protein